MFIELSASAVIGSDYFGFGFMTLHVNSTPQVGRGGGRRSLGGGVLPRTFFVTLIKGAAQV